MSPFHGFYQVVIAEKPTNLNNKTHGPIVSINNMPRNLPGTKRKEEKKFFKKSACEEGGVSLNPKK